MEGIIAEAKNLHALNHAKYRRLEKVQIQASMTASALNLKRLQAAN
ncbi:transposase [Candidatus Odyssella acanthamoebae]|nr:transposase [Candidatus Paracaedibacter acanthamoebae]